MLYGSPPESDPDRAAERGREVAAALGDRDSEEALVSLQGMIALTGDAEAFERGIGLLERGLREAGASRVDPRTLTLRRGLVWAYLLDGRFALANAGLDEVVAELERTGARGTDTWFGARFFRARARFWSDQLESAWQEALDTYEEAGALGNTTVHVSSAATLALVAYQRADYDAARKWADLSLAISTEIGNLPAMRNAATAGLGALLAQGAPARGTRYLEWIFEGLGDAGDLAITSHLIVEVLIAAGELARAERVAERLRESGGRLRRMLADLALAAVQRERGQLGEAKRALAHALEIAEEIGSRSGVVAGLLGCGEIALAAAASDRAIDPLSRALALGREAGLHRWADRAQRLLGEQSAREAPRRAASEA
jgi:tetratricopeptide (TPR) repeat protein